MRVVRAPGGAASSTTVEDYASPATLCRPLCPHKPALAADVEVDTSLQSWKCPFCEFLAAQADKALADAKTDKEILEFMRKECNDLPQSFAEPCVHYVDTEGVPRLAAGPV